MIQSLVCGLQRSSLEPSSSHESSLFFLIERTEDIKKILIEKLDKVDEFLNSLANVKEERGNLTREIVEKFLEDEDNISISKCISIDDDAAEILAKHKGYLYLSGLRELSDAAAESLAKQQGYLNLDGLSSLTDTVAQSLSRHQGCPASENRMQFEDFEFLNLKGLTELSDAAAESLSKHQGILNLSGLTSLTDTAAESLSKHEGKIVR